VAEIPNPKAIVETNVENIGLQQKERFFWWKLARVFTQMC